MEYTNNKTVHFICTGNLYRSRMAEAYFNHLNIPGIRAISSGTEAKEGSSIPIYWCALRIIYNNWLVDGMSRDSKSTTLDMLKSSDFVIFMEQKHFDYCKDVLKYVPEFYQIWNIDDLSTNGLDDDTIIKVSEATFVNIKANIDKLVTVLKNS